MKLSFIVNQIESLGKIAEMRWNFYGMKVTHTALDENTTKTKILDHCLYTHWGHIRIPVLGSQYSNVFVEFKLFKKKKSFSSVSQVVFYE